MEKNYHIPALLAETMESLAIQPFGRYADLTFGGGGHSRAIMEQLGDRGRLWSFDQDADAYRHALEDPFWREAEASGRWQFVHGNFRYMANYLDYYGVAEYSSDDKESGLDGILADLGVSFHHFDEQARGFSFRFESPLDMRMNQDGGKTAADVLNTYDEEELARVLYVYGELKNSRQLARQIANSRRQADIRQTTDLLRAVAKDRYKVLDNGEIEVDTFIKKDLARLFQALRIEVNDELGALRRMLTSGAGMLRPGGHFAILTYHSLEDRIVKNFFKTGNTDGKVEKDFYGNVQTPFEGKTNNVITASAEEVERNPRARSAKLRVATIKQQR